MKVLRQMVDAIVIQILTYACEAGTTSKEEVNKLQAIK